VNRRTILIAAGAVAALWIASGVRTLDPAAEIGVVGSPVLPGLLFRTERGVVVAPVGLLSLARYPKGALEIPLPQAEEAMLEGANGTRFGFRGSAVLQIRPEAWEAAHRASDGHGLAGILLAAARAAGTRVVAAAGGRGGTRPALARELEGTLGEELAKRGTDLRRLQFASIDYLSVPAGQRTPVAPSKVLVIGLDGADWAILDPLLAAGRMPNLAKLIDDGIRAKLLSISPMLSPVVWTTIATGVEPSRHGILDFLVADPAGGPGQPVTSVQRKAPAVWELLSRSGVHVGVVAWWASWPADPVDGYLVTDRLAYQLFGFHSDREDPKGKTWPPELYEKIKPRIVAPESIDWSRVVPYLDGGRKRREDFDPAEQKLLDEFRTLLASGETYLNAALIAREEMKPQLEIVYFEGTDTVGHLFMPYRPPARPGVDPRRFASFHDIVDRYYETADGYIGKLLEGKGDDWTVVVLSDHGFSSDATRPLTTDSRIGHGPAADWHRKFGILVLSGKGVQKGGRIDEASVYDFAPSVLALFGQPVPSSWPGRVLGDGLTPDLLARYPVRFRQDSPERDEPDEDAASAADPAAAELREKLRNLGYIGAGPDSQTSISAANNTGVALMAEGKYREAAEQFRRGLDEQPNQPNLRVNLGLALRMLGKDDEARAEFEKAMAAPAARRSAGHQLAQIALDRGELERAASLLRQVLEAEPGAADVRNSLGLVLEKQGRLKEAEDEYRRAAQDDPNASQPRSNLGNLAKTRGDLAEAERWYLAAIEADPYFMGAYNNLALVYQTRGEMDKAIDLYARALSKSPNNAVVMNNLGSLYYARGEMDAARGMWRRSALADPKYPSPLNNLGGVELAEGNLAVAEGHLAKALQLEPGYGDARINLSLVRARQGKPDEARAELEKAIADPRSRAGALAQLGYLELQAGRFPAASKALQDARRASPRNREVLNALGEALLAQGKTVEAIEAWNASLAVAPNQADVRARLESVAKRN